MKAESIAYLNFETPTANSVNTIAGTCFYPLFADEDGEMFLEEREGLRKILPLWDDGFEGCWTWEPAKAERDLDLLLAQEVNGRWKIYRKSYASGADRMLKTILSIDLSIRNAVKGTQQAVQHQGESLSVPQIAIPTRTIVPDRNDRFGHHHRFLRGVGHNRPRSYAAERFGWLYKALHNTQLPEPLDADNNDQKAGADFCDKIKKPRNLAELTKERLRRAGKKVREENPMFAGDFGFRVFKLASSNIRAWEPDRDDLPTTLQESAEHLKTDRTEAGHPVRAAAQARPRPDYAHRAESQSLVKRVKASAQARCLSALPRKSRRRGRTTSARHRGLAQATSPGRREHRGLPRQRLRRRRGQDQPHRHPPAARAGKCAEPMTKEAKGGHASSLFRDSHSER